MVDNVYKHVYTSLMSPKELTAFRIEPNIMDAMRRLKDREGVPLSVQVDRALRAWLEEKGFPVDKPKKSGRAAKTVTRRRRA
jgi:hypothetical protein